jgi:hypothetical protein
MTAITRIDHVQLAIPAGAEDRCRAFYALLGFDEAEKPSALRSRGGAWFRSDSVELHLGVDPDFRPARKRIRRSARPSSTASQIGCGTPDTRCAGTTRSPACGASSATIRSATGSS